MEEHQESQRGNGAAAECRGTGSRACNSPVGAEELNTSPRGKPDSLDEETVIPQERLVPLILMEVAVRHGLLQCGKSTTESSLCHTAREGCVWVPL